MRVWAFGSLGVCVFGGWGLRDWGFRFQGVNLEQNGGKSCKNPY